jgi:hypothetical protein
MWKETGPEMRKPNDRTTERGGYMGRQVSALAVATLLLTGCASGGLATVLPTPTDIAVIPPASDLAPEIAAFSGTWEGVWDGVLPSRLIVERIDATSARVVYVWGTLPGVVEPGWGRFRARVLPGGKIHWGSSVRFTFSMSKDRTSIAGEREAQDQTINTVTMKKVGER